MPTLAEVRCIVGYLAVSSPWSDEMNGAYSAVPAYLELEPYLEEPSGLEVLSPLVWKFPPWRVDPGPDGMQIRETSASILPLQGQ